MKDNILDIVGVVGAVAISVGVGMYSLPAGIIVAGGLMVAAALLLSRGEANDDQRPNQ